MSGLAFAEAPPPSLPLRFLLTALGWGVFAGVWLAWVGAEAMLSRWTPATLVLVHALVLGLLGNAMLGSLLQFLPVATASPLPGRGAMPWLHAGFNAGVALLLATFARNAHVLALPATGLLAGTLLPFAALALWAVVRGHGDAQARRGIALALLALAATVATGAWLLSARTGWLAPPVRSFTDLHAGLGIVGWVVGLLAAVAGIALPTLQGTRALPARAHAAWRTLLVAALAVLALDRHWPLPSPLHALPVLPVAVFAAAALVLQARSPHVRNPVLRRFWMLGCASLLLACAALALPEGPHLPAPALLAGVLALAVGLPALVVGMALEITAFLAWIALRRRMPRGTRVPGVGRLFEEAHKRRLFALHAAAAALLVLAACAPAWARVAGVAMALAHAAALHGAWRCWRGAARFVPPPPAG